MKKVCLSGVVSFGWMTEEMGGKHLRNYSNITSTFFIIHHHLSSIHTFISHSKGIKVWHLNVHIKQAIVQVSFHPLQHTFKLRLLMGTHHVVTNHLLLTQHRAIHPSRSHKEGAKGICPLPRGGRDHRAQPFPSTCAASFLFGGRGCGWVLVVVLVVGGRENFPGTARG
jgi:hypothetical protein